MQRIKKMIPLLIILQSYHNIIILIILNKSSDCVDVIKCVLFKDGVFLQDTCKTCMYFFNWYT